MSNANVGHGDVSAGMLKGVLSVVDLEVAWGFLVGGIAHVASFLEVSAFICGQVGAENKGLSELHGFKGNVVNWFAQSIGVGSLR